MGKVISLFKEIHTAQDSIRRENWTSPDKMEFSEEQREKALLLLNSRDQNTHLEAKAKIITFAEFYVPVANRIFPEWKGRVKELLELDSRTNRFAAIYLRLHVFS